MPKNRVFLALSIACLTSSAYLLRRECFDPSPTRGGVKSGSTASELGLEKSFAVTSSRSSEKRRLKIVQKPQQEVIIPVVNQAKIKVTANLDQQSSQDAQAKEVLPLPIPRPNIWSLEFKNETLTKAVVVCADREACSPRGRDGVLLLGLSLAMNGRDVSLQQSLGLGAYYDRTPLLVMK